MAYTACLVASAFNGIYNASSPPTVTILSTNQNLASIGAPIACGITSWVVKNEKGATVASGSVSSSATSFTVATSGTWASGGTVAPGKYFVIPVQTGIAT